MQVDQKGDVVHLHEDLYLVRSSLIRKADKTIKPGEKVLRFSNPRTCMLNGKKVARGFEPEEMDELGESIIEQGLNHPLVVRPMKGEQFCLSIAYADSFEDVDGERRLRRILKMIAENRLCRASNGEMIPAAQRYEFIECRIKVLNDLQAYHYAFTSPGVPIGQGAMAYHVRYLKDCSVPDADILKAVGKKSKKWLEHTLTITELDEDMLGSFVREELNREGALYYAGIADVAKRHDEFDKAKKKAGEQHAKHYASAEHRLHRLELERDRKECDLILAEHKHEGVEEAAKAVEAVEQKVEAQAEKVEEVAKAPVKVTRRHIDRGQGDIGNDGKPKSKFITRKTIQDKWVVPLEQALHDGNNPDLDPEDAKFVLNIWQAMQHNEKDILKVLRDCRRKDVCPHSTDGVAKCVAEALVEVTS